MNKMRVQNLAKFAESISDRYSMEQNIDKRKIKGQIFTPEKIASYMVNMFKFHPKQTLSFLDPGAGTGVLTAAVCDSLLKTKPQKIIFDLYENDKHVLPFLERTISECKRQLNSRGFKAKFNIINKDFVLHNEAFFNGSFHTEKIKLYDYIISNPPYFKLNKKSLHSKAMEFLVSGQPNIYSFFMALATKMLNTNGQMVFITPRSFCSGLYYNRFRKWFLNSISLMHIHIFESRKSNFVKDNILQENIIIKAVNSDSVKNVILSNSTDASFSDYKEFKARNSDVIFKQNGDIIIRIPTSESDLKIISLIDNWKNTLNNLGFQISTGPVVAFRASKYLLNKSNGTTAPLLWMHNLSSSFVDINKTKENKPNAIVINKNTMPILLPTKNYVLLNRFSSKEQKRRLLASVLLRDKFSSEYVGVENHLNYIYKPRQELTIDEAFGLMALFKSSIFDKYFRILNGNTQVNASDIKLLPFPSINTITKIGNKCRNVPYVNHDEIVNETLKIEILGVA